MSSDTDSAMVDAPARTGGTLLATGIRALSALRPADKPFHPRGTVLRGVLRRHGGERSSGVAYLDEPGQEDVIVRLSRAVGLPRPAPDIFGVAIRVPGVRDGAPSDLLLATTGRGTLTRFVLTPHLEGHDRVYTSLLPYRSPQGPLWLAARRTEDDAYELAWARATGGWVVFGRLELGDTPDEDEPVSFDPVENPLPGLPNYGWVRRLRQPSYVVARRSSGRIT